MTVLATWPLLDGEPPRTIEEAEVVFGVRFAHAHAGHGSVTLRDPTPQIVLIRMLFESGFMEPPGDPSSVREYRGRRSHAWWADLVGGRDVAEARFAARWGPGKHGSTADRAFTVYGPYVVMDAPTPPAWRLEWYAELPDWAVTGVDPDAQRAALQRLLASFGAADSIADVIAATPLDPDAGVLLALVEGAGAWDRRLRVKLRPRVPAGQLAELLGMRLVEVHDYSCEDSLGKAVEQIVRDDDHTIVVQAPAINGWRLDLAVAYAPHGKELADGVFVLAPDALVESIAAIRRPPKPTQHPRIRYGFVDGAERDAIIDLGAGCFTGQRLPDPVFVPQAVRFAWFPADAALWEVLRELASDAGEAELYSLAAAPWVEAGVGVFRIPRHVRAEDFRELLDARAVYGVPPLLWFFGPKREWAAIVDREIGLAVVGVVRPNYHFKQLDVAGSISLPRAIDLACARVAPAERRALTARYRLSYGAGSIDGLTASSTD